MGRKIKKGKWEKGAEGMGEITTKTKDACGGKGTPSHGQNEKKPESVKKKKDQDLDKKSLVDIAQKPKSPGEGSSKNKRRERSHKRHEGKTPPPPERKEAPPKKIEPGFKNALGKRGGRTLTEEGKKNDPARKRKSNAKSTITPKIHRRSSRCWGIEKYSLRLAGAGFGRIALRKRRKLR